MVTLELTEQQAGILNQLLIFQLRQEVSTLQKLRYSSRIVFEHNLHQLRVKTVEKLQNKKLKRKLLFLKNL